VLLAFVPLSLSASAGETQTSDKSPQKNPSTKSNPLQETKSGLDDALLKDLDNELLEDAGEMKRKAEPRTTEAGEESSPAEAVDDQTLEKPSDPLVYISQEMRRVEGLIPKRTEGPHAEQLQQRIIDDLARLIEQAEKQQAAQKASQSKQQSQSAKRQGVKQSKPITPGKDSNQPAKDSTERMGKSEDARADAAQRKTWMKEAWGHLPPHAREQVLQNSPERFLPQYELLIEQYYKRLAEQQPAK
jgi:hypothetical protein